eukprot:7912267-Alexandrium_andersonii.AAC.1
MLRRRRAPRRSPPHLPLPHLLLRVRRWSHWRRRSFGTATSRAVGKAWRPHASPAASSPCRPPRRLRRWPR